MTLLMKLYTRRLRRELAGKVIPEHVGVVIDGNRRWARGQGFVNPSVGHRYGAYHVENLLRWCEAAGIRHVTVFLCSTENLVRRGDAEVAHLMQVTEEIVAERLTRPEARWRIHLAGLLDLLPDSTARALKGAVEHTRDSGTGNHLTLAIGYGGRQEIVEAIRRLLESAADSGTDPGELARELTAADIARHLDTAGMPEPELIIRTSGEQRMSNFLLWQSVHSELFFCDTYWPAFREIDFLRILRSYTQRKS